MRLLYMCQYRCMATGRRRLSPEDRRAELLALGGQVFGQRPYDDVRVDEIAEMAGVSRALMYHYFPDKRAFFAEVVRAETARLFEATSARVDADGDGGLFDLLRGGVLAYLRYDEEHPHTAWAAYVGVGQTDPVLRGIEDVDSERQARRVIAGIQAQTAQEWDDDARRVLRATVYSWVAFVLEFARQRIVEPALSVETVADICAHALLDAIVHAPGFPADLVEVAKHRPHVVPGGHDE
jgi:AcrR family transcriptional regulator